MLNLSEQKDPIFLNNYVDDEYKEEDIGDLSPKKLTADYGVAKIDKFSSLITEVTDEETFRKFIESSNTWIQGEWYGKRKSCYKNPFLKNFRNEIDFEYFAWMVPIVWLREQQVTQEEHDEGFMIQIEDWTQNYESKMRGKIESMRVTMQRRNLLVSSPIFGKEVRPRVLRDGKPRIICQKIWMLNFWDGKQQESNE